MKLINNQDIRFIDELSVLLSAESEVFLSCNYFTFLAFFELFPAILDVKSIRILIDGDVQKDVRFGYDSKEFLTYADLSHTFKARQVSKLLKEKSEIRSGNLGGQKFVLVKNAESVHCFSIVPQDFNLVSLGVLRSENPIFLTYFEDTSIQYLNLFNQFWNISSVNLKSIVLRTLDKVISTNSPEFIYKYTLSKIFENSVVNEENEQRITKIGFKQTEVWRMLFNFQKDAVLGAIDKIESFGGCIIADSVGLGKTFEALAVMKYYQMRNDRILVLCPKKLRDNWTIYTQNDVRNVLSKDRFNYDVLNHTDLSRSSGISGDLNLETINWGNYDLVVIDESHTFRNNNPKRDGVTRYQRLMNDIIKSGVKTKVLMLSATPVNTRMNDIKNQISFITEQNDIALKDYGIISIEQTLRRAQARFNTWLKDGDGVSNDRESLITNLDGSYFKLLDLLTIARSRRHIEKYYDVSDIGKFPDRLVPINRYSDFDIKGLFPALDKVNDELNALNLGVYSPLSYVRADKRASYEEKYDITTSTGSIFKQVERESSLIHLMRVNLLKRLESSVHSFRLTIQAILDQIDRLILKIETIQTSEFFDQDLDINSVDVDDDMLEELLTGGKVKVLLQDIDLIRCKEDLVDDKNRLLKLLSQTKNIGYSRDAKLLELKQLILEKCENQLNVGNKKVIIFSAFSDTVKYLYEGLSDWLLNEQGLYSAQVTGGDSNKTNLKSSRNDLSSILTNFSPISKKRDIIFPDAVDEIDILFCTDCISEGQNLQDCDYLVNYDIHWNPVRIIQRFGRIDRIGSKNDKIQLVNFFPNLALDTYIDLIGRVKGRMQILDVSATGDDNIIEENTQHHDLEYRKKQLKQLQTKVMDLEDIDGGISITDLTFNDFKIDADRLSPVEREEFNLTPHAIYSLTTSNEIEAPTGVIFCVKDLNLDQEFGLSLSAIYPYSLCYINADGEAFVTANNPKKSLDYYKKLCLNKIEVDSSILEMFDKEVRLGKNMERYASLFKTAISNIKGVEDEMGLETLALPGGTRVGTTSNDESFELISYLIVK